MTDKKFAVVRFDDGSVSEVPAEWLTDNDTHCWWPKSKKPTYLIKKCIVPLSDQPENWEKSLVEVETYCESYKVARNKAQDINYTESEDNQDIRKGKRKIFKKKMLDDFDLSSSEEEQQTRTLSAAPQLLDMSWHSQEGAVVMPLDGPPILTAVAGNFNFNNNDEELNYESPKHDFPQNIIVLGNAAVPPIKESDVGENTTLKKILNLLIEIKLQNVEIIEALSHSKHVDNGTQERFLELESDIPLNDFENFDIFMEKLKSTQQIDLFKSYIKTIGGSCPRDYVNRALGRLISNELAAKCSWLGLRNNKRMQGTPILEILRDIVIATYQNLTHKDYEHIASEWFRHAAQRLRRQKNNSLYK